MPFNASSIYKRVLAAQATHTKFLSATEKNLSYFYFGRSLSMIRQSVFPEVDILDALSSYSPNPYNPVGYLVSAFIDEIANSEFRTSVKPWPVTGQEPYESFADYLEDYLREIHRRNKRPKYIRALVFELLIHGYFGIYTNGFNYSFLSAYELIPGDPSISGIQNQPFLVRKTKARKSFLKRIPGLDLNKELNSSLELVSDLDNIGLYDVWCKDLDLNICFTEGGQTVYAQHFPYPKRYPFFIPVDSELLDSFYPIPTMQRLGPLLSKLQEAQESIEESSKSIAKPLLVYDADAGIDINMLQRALKEGYKHIIIGKNREGDIAYRSPGYLPSYAVSQPDRIVDQMMKHLGLTSMFLGNPTAGVRERGALNRLIKASFRKLSSKASLIEEAFTDLDEYLIDYLREHKLKAADKFKFKNIEEIFSSSRIRYIPKEKFYGFSSEDTYENRSFVLSEWRSKLIPQEEALEELGHTQPRKLMEKIQDETKSNQKFLSELRQASQQEKPKSLLDEVAERLKGKLKNRFSLTPLADDKVLVTCHQSEAKKVGFILADLSKKVFIEEVKEESQPPLEQRGLKVEDKNSGESQNSKDLKSEIEGKPIVPSEQVRGETRGRPATHYHLSSEIKKTKTSKEILNEKSNVSAFSEKFLQDLVRASKIIRLSQIKKYLGLPGLYIVEPHAKWIYSGKKLLIIKARKYDIVDKPYLLCGKQVYGVIIVRRITDNFDFKATQKYHLVSEREKEKWWKGNKLYLYMFEFHPFERPLDYIREKGVQTFINQVRIKPESIGLPYRGDLKPIVIKPWIVPPPHKPEKKAFQPHEVFSLKRLKEIIPEAVYDVSYKVDGLRAFLWIHNGVAKMFSDVGNQWPKSRVKTILDEAQERFKTDMLLDGELVIKQTRRKDIAGYIHGQWKPTQDQLSSLRYICWDVLYIKDRSIASLPFSKRSSILDLYLPYKSYQKSKIQRVLHGVAKNRDEVPALAKKVMSAEGVVIRDVNASYWATHTTYKAKRMFDVDTRVFAVSKTALGLPIFYCELRDGTYIGKTYAQSEVTAKPGDIIRVNIEHVSIRPDGSVNWYAPRPHSWKEGKIVPKKISTTQVGIGGPDTLDLIKEIYLTSGGTEEKWDKWLPLHLKWKKEKMPKLKAEVKKEILKK